MPITQDAPIVRTRRPNPVQRLLTVTQASEVFGIPQRTIHDLISRGVLAFVRFPDARRLWLDRASGGTGCGIEGAKLANANRDSIVTVSAENENPPEAVTA